MTVISTLSPDADNWTGVSGWRTVSQIRINQFAQATEDFQFIHVDPLRASLEGPFHGTIAHGFLTLSLISTMASDVIEANLFKSVMIAAIDRVKFTAPVRAGARVRGVFKLDRSTYLTKDRVLFKILVKIEVEHEQKPALTCDVSWIAEMHEAAFTSVAPQAMSAEATL